MKKDYFICQHCGDNAKDVAHGEIPLCDICEQWGITSAELYPTLSDVFSEQFHRIGKDGKKYWGRLGAGILFTNGKQVLLLKRSDDSDFADHWCIPGGKSKEKENPLDTALREAKEECGTAEGQRSEHFHSIDGSHHFHTYLFTVAKPFPVTLSKEHKDSKWVDLDEVADMNLHPKFKESWQTYLRAIRKRFPEKVSFADWCESKGIS
jgi:8-oxo-dGTP pyrophosphatase MutT (NUDIX family)